MWNKTEYYKFCDIKDGYFFSYTGKKQQIIQLIRPNAIMNQNNKNKQYEPFRQKMVIKKVLHSMIKSSF